MPIIIVRTNYQEYYVVQPMIKCTSMHHHRKPNKITKLDPIITTVLIVIGTVLINNQYLWHYQWNFTPWFPYPLFQTSTTFNPQEYTMG